MSEDERNPIENTERREYGTPLLLRVLAGETALSRGIEEMEAAGARQVASQTSRLPTRGLDVRVCEAIGIEVGNVVADDPIFTEVGLPDGWKIETTRHGMWTTLVDDHGSPRASIFYKAAFYDRGAHVSFTTRIRVFEEYDENSVRKVVVDVGNASGVGGADPKEYGLYVTGTVIFVSNWREFGDLEDELRTMNRWLDENWPNWRDPVTHWESVPRSG